MVSIYYFSVGHLEGRWDVAAVEGNENREGQWNERGNWKWFKTKPKDSNSIRLVFSYCEYFPYEWLRIQQWVTDQITADFKATSGYDGYQNPSSFLETSAWYYQECQN